MLNSNLLFKTNQRFVILSEAKKLLTLKTTHYKPATR